MKRFRFFCEPCQNYTPPVMSKDARGRMSFRCFHCKNPMHRLEVRDESCAFAFSITSFLERPTKPVPK
jgi:hypothetical protein